VLEHADLTTWLEVVRADDAERARELFEAAGTPTRLLLLHAVIQKRLDLLRDVLQVGVDVCGERPLLVEAIYAGWDVASVRTLIAHGADPGEEAQDGTTPLSAARSHEREDLVALFLASGAPDPAFLGVARCYDDALSARILQDCGLAQGAVIAGVAERGPAERAGIRAHDVLIAIDGQPISTFSELSRLVSSRAVGASLKCTVARRREAMVVSARLEPRPGPVRYVGVTPAANDSDLDFEDED